MAIAAALAAFGAVATPGAANVYYAAMNHGASAAQAAAITGQIMYAGNYAPQNIALQVS